MENEIKISIVIPTYRHLEDAFKPAIESIIKYTNLNEIEVLIVANGCGNDGTKEYVESLGKPFKLLWIEEPAGYTKATNYGIERALGEKIILLNNDTVLLPQEKNKWIDLLKEPFNDSSVGITSPVKFFIDTMPKRFAVPFWLAMIKREVFEKIGILDEIFSPGGCEDIDFCFRAYDRGYKIVQVPNDNEHIFLKEHPEMIFPIYHKGNGTFGDNHTLKNNICDRNMNIVEERYGYENSIIIPTLGKCDELLKPLCESIIQYTDLSNTEIIIVSNGSKDNTREYVESLGNPFKLLWFDKPLGYTKATNEGIKVAKGKNVILLNNDCLLLPQEKDTWIKLLLDPLKDETVGATGPIYGYSEPANRKFLVFFCAAMRREMFEKVGLLDEIFSPGGGEDTDWCIKCEDLGYKILQVPTGESLGYKDGLCIGSFPIFHRGEATVRDKTLVPEWNEIFERNSQILRERYNYQWKLGNNCERAVITSTQDLKPFPREENRYRWAAEHLIGKKVLEIGCSSGYGQRMLPEDIDYLGVDYSPEVIEYARKEFPQGKYQVVNLEEHYTLGDFDTIIAFEILEHLVNGKELAQELKKHCKCLLATVPYNENKGTWGPHHKLHNLTEKDFPDFSYRFMDMEGKIMYHPNNQSLNLMLMLWKNQ